MRFVGLGFRAAATVASFRSAVAAAGGFDCVVALATSENKASAAALQALAAETGLPIRAIPDRSLSAVETLTVSRRVTERFGTGSLAEAAALAAAGPAGRLLGPRKVSADGMATAAIAEVKKT